MKNKDIFDLLFSSRVLLFGGEYGRGKTLSMIAYCYYASALNNIRQFITNMPFNLKGFEKINQYIPLLQTSEFDKSYQNCIFFMDELHRDLDARDFMSVKNRYLMKWAVDLRKDNSQVIGSVQYFDNLEKRATDLLQIIIIPTFCNTYSYNEKEDRQIRLEKHDFNTNWFIIDRKTEQEYNLKLNLYPFLNMYNTKFHPIPLIINHRDYMEYINMKWSKTKVEAYKSHCQENLKYSMENFNMIKNVL